MAGPMVAGVEEEVLRAYEFDGCQRYDGALQIHAILLRVILPRTADRIKGSPSFITRYFALGWPLPRGIH
jgi:hypothetical protein